MNPEGVAESGRASGWCRFSRTHKHVHPFIFTYCNSVEILRTRKLRHGTCVYIQRPFNSSSQLLDLPWGRKLKCVSAKTFFVSFFFTNSVFPRFLFYKHVICLAEGWMSFLKEKEIEWWSFPPRRRPWSYFGVLVCPVKMQKLWGCHSCKPQFH